jgi:hypothetical protein
MFEGPEKKFQRHIAKFLLVNGASNEIKNSR